MIHLVIGGARSGKSVYAETLAGELSQSLGKHCPHKQSTAKKLIYLATATIYDDEMQQRIDLHQQRRDQDWSLVEEPLQLASCLQTLSGTNAVVLIDCMTLWLSNWICSDNFAEFESQRQKFIATLIEFDGDCVIVSNEVGSGIVPMGELSRSFVDHAGWLNQAIAKVSDTSTLVVAGLPLVLKG
ncbi:Cobinamide kinase/cobinamide phosphate guanylyltransferase [Moritella viscosa]|uniref:Bifunctional adenosylcobalamin biosynthesis protein n=1 Tax=Moritella viscosa TaxID=80854 RepID=A0A090IJU0_9GAMM|nr:bifunctional adenosylcobinamide kinase/adenosylcobinamide-phosphate guanylyltransferase [Moritella viscosa]CED61527.1 cobinamide kinase/cobinamide phosphate guanylyltransferase [Moritella viscosa]SGY97422.1 Cobinamide kinase/cobinamide phosphate guanylyltransferase [Moritella viscosa]SHO04737.1 Cobinamide kinase/cobinamide phosphate guanylyltransferase [Moritella viscosa]SHO04739.1 Cobinamide kinase/cobinamide phosphate guanylyltransferase [Moritella viscosa]SHO05692.1 Cobinamide kinase/cob